MQLLKSGVLGFKKNCFVRFGDRTAHPAFFFFLSSLSLSLSPLSLPHLPPQLNVEKGVDKKFANEGGRFQS
jgi:hypothetical protein